MPFEQWKILKIIQKFQEKISKIFWNMSKAFRACEKISRRLQS